MTDNGLPADSIDALIAQRLPAWLTGTENLDRLSTLHAALRAQEQATRRLDGILSNIPSIEAFAEPLLEAALSKVGISPASTRAGKVRIEQEITAPTAAPNLPKPTYVHKSRQSLVATALHNFHVAETRPSITRRAWLTDGKGNTLQLGFEVFAGMCRAIDVGARYQALLKTHLLPVDLPGEVPGAGVKAVEQAFEQSLRSHLDTALRLAVLKGELDEQSYLHLLPVAATQPVVPALPSLVIARQLYLLGKCVCGVAAIELRASADGPLEGVVAWVPGAQQPLTRHDSWQALYDALAEQLRDEKYRHFFARFIGERDRIAFFTALAKQLAAVPSSGIAQLDGRNLAIDFPLFEHLRRQRIDKLLDDARVLAIPTGDEDADDRRERLDAYASLGMNILTLAGLFVPVLGELLLVDWAAQIAYEVYEGYEDWSIGDRQGALDHMFGVAENVIVGALIAKGSSLARGALDRVAFVDGLAPVRGSAGEVRLIDPELRAYQSQKTAITGANQRLWYIDDTAFEVLDAAGEARIQPLIRPHAHAPRLDTNGDGAWRHEFEQPQHWQGAGMLLRRLSGTLADISDATAEHLLQVTGYDTAQVRRLLLENVAAPARLHDALELHQAHEQFPALRGQALSDQVAGGEPLPSANETVLRGAFPGLTLNAAREVLGQATGAELDSLAEKGRVPLAMAERARGYLRDSRLDRACAGLLLPRATGADTECLAMSLIDSLAPWPESVRVELHESTAAGPLLQSQGGAAASEVRTVIRQADGYYLPDDDAGPLGLLQALRLSMDETQRQLLGDAGLGEEALAERLAQHANSDRAGLPQRLGMAPVSGNLRPPQRFADGRLGYALSGRAGGSRQSLRRGIHQVFPTLSDDAMQEYLLDLMNRRIGLWEHYSVLQDHLARLRTALREWRNGWTNPLDAVRRLRVATALRRSWRRKITNPGGEYVLHIDGEAVGSLPALPAGVSYGHVRRLTLRNMGLTQVDEDFLSRFSNLVELDLTGNRLTQIPAGVGSLRQLRQLHLARNQIVLDLAGERHLQALRALQVLDISNNPLGRAPVLTRLPNLRSIRLRAVGLESVPDGIHWQATVDLRDNRIRQLRQDLNSLRHRVEQLSLHDNPLESASQVLLDEAAGVAVAGSRGSVAFRHNLVDERLRDEWIGSLRGEHAAARRATWQALQEEEGSAGLFRFLADFIQTEDYQEHSSHFRTRIWYILEACEQHHELRTRLFLEAAGPQTCEDRLLLVLTQLELGVMVEREVGGVAADQVEPSLLRLERGLSRLDQVDRLASLHVQRLRGDNVLLVDEIEVRLFYRVKLARSLALPIDYRVMHYESFANVTTSDLLRAQAHVLEAENAQALVASLAERPFWQAHVRERYATRLSAVAERFHGELEQLQAELDARKIDEWTFNLRTQGLKYEYETAERKLMRTLAREVYDRLNP